MIELAWQCLRIIAIERRSIYYFLETGFGWLKLPCLLCYIFFSPSLHYHLRFLYCARRYGCGQRWNMGTTFLHYFKHVTPSIAVSHVILIYASPLHALLLVSAIQHRYFSPKLWKVLPQYEAHHLIFIWWTKECHAHAHMRHITSGHAVRCSRHEMLSIYKTNFDLERAEKNHTPELMTIGTSHRALVRYYRKISRHHSRRRRFSIFRPLLRPLQHFRFSGNFH